MLIYLLDRRVNPINSEIGEHSMVFKALVQMTSALTLSLSLMVCHLRICQDVCPEYLRISVQNAQPDYATVT